MSDEWKATGVWDALLIDLLLGLSMNPDEVMAMSGRRAVERRMDEARIQVMDPVAVRINELGT